MSRARLRSATACALTAALVATAVEAFAAPQGETERQKALREAKEFGLRRLANPPPDPDAPIASAQRFDAKPAAPSVQLSAVKSSGRLPQEVIARIVRQRLNRIRLCYDAGLRVTPRLGGDVPISFTIDKDGLVRAFTTKSALPDKIVLGCIANTFGELSFPEPEGGQAKVSLSISLAPGAPKPIDRPAALTLGGKALANVTAPDLEKALKAAGCTDVTRVAKGATPKVIVFRATRAKGHFTVTFVANSTRAGLSIDAWARLAKRAAIRRDGLSVLAVESEDSGMTDALAGDLVAVHR